MIQGPLVDAFGRVHTNLRLSVTDRCNIRCFYCMPTEQVQFRPRHEILSFEEITRFVRVAARLGIRKIRITGGEPLVRSQLPALVRLLRQIPGIDELALTTNGVLLAEQAAALRQAGLDRLNISLDTLDPEKFQRLTRRDLLDRVLKGIFAARTAGFQAIKLNAIAVRNMTEDEIVPLAQFARQHDLELRFIEYMPLDGDRTWHSDQVLQGAEILRRLEQAFGPLEPIERTDASQPATDYRFASGQGRIGLITPVSQPFCEQCNRLRLTAEGQIRNCLFSTDEWDARALLRANAPDEDLARLIRACVAGKHAARGGDSSEFVRPDRAMFQIGG